MAESEPKTDRGPLMTVDQWIGVAGIVLTVVAIFSPVLEGSGNRQSLLLASNTVAAIVLGLAVGSAWSLNRRNTQQVFLLGVLGLIVVVVEFASLRHQAAVSSSKGFGFFQLNIVNTGWILLLIGYALQLVSSRSALYAHRWNPSTLGTRQAVLWAAMANRLLALVFCLLVIFVYLSDIPSIRDRLRPWADEMLVVRCLLLGSLLAWISIQFANRESLEAANRTSPWSAYRLLWLPVLMFALFLVGTLQLDDLVVFLGPGIVLLVLGNGIVSPRPSLQLVAAVISFLVLGGVALLGFQGIPNELLELGGFTRHEGIVVLLVIGVWSVLMAIIQYLRRHVEVEHQVAVESANPAS